MKQLKKALLCVALTLPVLLFVISCNKETVEISTETPSSTRSEPIVVNFDRTYGVTGSCIPIRGLCTSTFTSRNDWAAYKLLNNEAKGEAWATEISSNISQITYHLGSEKMSSTLFFEFVKDSAFTIAEDTYIPQSLVSSIYRNAGIKNVPSEVKLPKGKYPVIPVNPPTTPSPQNKWVVTVTVHVEYSDGKWKTTFDTKVTWVSP